jgi:hypothetical protein
MGCGPVSIPSSLEHNTYRVPPLLVTDTELATYRRANEILKNVLFTGHLATLSSQFNRKGSWTFGSYLGATSESTFEEISFNVFAYYMG